MPPHIYKLQTNRCTTVEITGFANVNKRNHMKLKENMNNELRKKPRSSIN